MNDTSRLLYAFETHDAALIRALRAGGLDLSAPINGRPPIDLLVEMYLRSPRFVDCLKAMSEGGAVVEDALVRALLFDDDQALNGLLAADPGAKSQKLRLACAYVSLDGVSPLHVCAEYNSLRCARLLLASGADINARAETNEDGTGGHTPLFHAVNSNLNHCRPMMEALAKAGADLAVRVDALVWGGGFDWETVFFDMSPIAFAQAGLFPQVHRRARDVYDNVRFLYALKHRRDAPVRNEANKYLSGG